MKLLNSKFNYLYTDIIEYTDILWNFLFIIELVNLKKKIYKYFQREKEYQTIQMYW